MQNEQINTVKTFILLNAFSYGWNTASKKEMADTAQGIIYKVAQAGLGFASEIAETVLKYNKVSEKQAYWIAKLAVENEIA